MYLTSHIKRHAERTYGCTECDYKCVRKLHLKLHMLTHTGEKTYECTVCDYKASRKQYLANHMQSHSDVMPFYAQSVDLHVLLNMFIKCT